MASPTSTSGNPREVGGIGPAALDAEADYLATLRGHARQVRRSRLVVVAVSALALLVVATFTLLQRSRAAGDGTFETAVGERRGLVLADATRVTLNTASRVQVELTGGRRGVELMAGEALFEVAGDAARPFTLRVDGSEVVVPQRRASFVVRLAEAGQGGGATLIQIEGGASVRPLQEAAAAFAPVGLAPGDRLRIDPPGQAERTTTMSHVDRGAVDRILAWTRDEAVFDDASLAEAVDEMNRYSDRKIRIASDVRGTMLRVSGTFRTGDGEAFTRAVAAMHRLQVRQRAGGWEFVP